MLELRPNCECCDKDLPPDLLEACICSYRMHILPRLRRGRARRAMPQLRRRVGAPAGPAGGAAAPPSRRDQADLQAGRMRPGMTMRASRRGLVPPFIAMDVLRAANERRPPAPM